MSQPQVAVGASVPRVDARLRVTGRAKYAADNNPDGVVHAVIVDSTVGRGRLTGIDARAALAQTGVLKVISHLNAPKLPPLTGDGRRPGRLKGNPTISRADVVAFIYQAVHGSEWIHRSPVLVSAWELDEGAAHRGGWRRSA